MYTVCRQPGCENLIETNTGGWCPEHKAKVTKQYNKYSRDADVQKLYNSSRWKALRDRFRNQFPLCAECERAGHTTAGNLVDHIQEFKVGDDFFDLENLETLCTECHNKKHKSGKA